VADDAEGGRPDDEPIEPIDLTASSDAPVSGPDVDASPAAHPEADPGAGPETDVDPEARPSGPPSRKALAFVVVPLIGLVIASQLGDILGPGLVPRPLSGVVESVARSLQALGLMDRTEDTGLGPLLLLVLSPRLRWQVAVVNYVDPLPFFVLGTLRMLAADPPFYLLGRWYGDNAIEWAERRAPLMGRFLRDGESMFRYAAYPLVAIAPNNFICLLAGSSRMRPAVFFTLNIGGTVVRLWLVLQFGQAFADQIDVVLRWVATYRWYLIGLSALLVGGAALKQARSGTGELAQLRSLEDELEHPDGEL